MFIKEFFGFLEKELRKYFIKIIFFCLVFSFKNMAHGQSLFFLDSCIYNIEKKGFKNSEFQSLSFFKGNIKNKRIVFLGEDTHFDGKTLLCKNQIIKYLHDSLGFNVLIIEEDIFDTKRAYEDILSNKDSATGVLAYLRHVFSDLIADSDIELGRYIQDNISKTPLILAGYDIRPNSVYNNAFWLELEGLLKKVAPNFKNSQLYSSFLKFSNKGRLKKTLNTEDYLAQLKSLKLEVIENSANEIIDFLEKNEKSQDSLRTTLEFFIQAIHSKVGYYKQEILTEKEIMCGDFISFEYYKIREQYMVDNLLWLIQHKYPDQKIIVSSSSYHLGRNFDSLEARPCELGTAAVPAGQIIWNKYKDSLYSIAFISFDGSRGLNNEPQTIRNIHKTSNTLENYLHSKHLQYAFIDFSNITDSPSFYMEPTFNGEYKGQWPLIYDGVFFIDKMEPVQIFLMNNRSGMKAPYTLPQSWFSN